MPHRSAVLAIAASLLYSSLVAAKPSRATLDHIRRLAITRIGVDSTGSLWAWDGAVGTVTLLTPGGARRTYDVDFNIQAIDVESDRGIAILRKDGTTVSILPLHSTAISDIKLTNAANGIVWLDRDRIAVAPERAASLVEVWSTEKKSLLQTIGAVPVLKVPSKGASLNRATLVDFNAARNEITVFDAFYGNATVFDRNGQTIRTAQITHPRLGANMAWLTQVDANAKAQGESATPTMYNYARMSVSADGTIWLGEDGPTPETITIAKVTPNGKVERKPVAVPDCASVRYEIWQNELVVFREPRSPRKQCTSVKEVPR